MLSTDYLIVGSGIAGLSYAIKVAEHCPDKKVWVITKATPTETNTKYAQGGIASVMNQTTDSFTQHIQDTIIAGDYLSNAEVVSITIKEAPDRINELIEWGTHFDKLKSGNYELGLEGGHSTSRILHHKDTTGQEIERSLFAKASQLSNIVFLYPYFIIDLITQHHLGYLVTKSTSDITCYGVYAMNIHTRQIEKILASTVMLCTGGCGQAYKITTNPSIATGDGIAMFYRAKGRVENMEFIQFHPTALYIPNESPAFLITEAVRGEGGILINHKGEAFMKNHHELKDLAPRDIVARAIDYEMKKEGTDYVYLDCKDIPIDTFIRRFPTIYKKCKQIDIDVSQQPIPIVPASHYSCGGIKTDIWGRTSIKNVYASGECSSTGLHGANRLASNSLLEALVFSHRAFIDSTKNEKDINEIISIPIPEWDQVGTTEPKEMILITQSIKELKQIMSDYVGVVRTNVRLHRAMKRLDLLFDEANELYNNSILSPQLCELRNLITVGYLIVKSALLRKESRGLHFNTDYQEKQKNIQNIIL